MLPTRSSLLLVLVLLTVSLAAEETVVLGVTGNPASTQREMAAVVKHVNSSPTVALELKVFPSHEDLYAALAENKVDLAFLGAVKYIRARHELGAVPIVSEGPAARGLIAVPSGSPIQRVEDLRGKTVAFGYKDSTTTHLIPLLLLSKHGLRQNDVKSHFAGHFPQAAVDAVLAGKADACAVADATYVRNRAKLRVLAESEGFPGPPVVARKGLAANVVADVRRQFLSYKPASANAGERFSKGTVAVTDDDYNRVRFLVKSLFNKMYL
jgi:phosphonate transport system substrate-binding protein